MTLFNPVWRVTIGGVQYQTAILANLTITSGRTNIYEQAQAGYTNLEIINLNHSNVAIGINDSITIELQDSTATFVPIFGGSVVEVGIAVAEVGSVDYAQRINIIALGALARLPKALTEGVLNDDFDGGETYYPQHNFSVKPKLGRLAIHPGDSAHEHGVSEIKNNTRYTLAAVWTRNRKYSNGNE